MIAIPTEHTLAFLRPFSFLVEPGAAQELPNASVVGLFLRRFQGDQFVEIFINRGGFACTAV